jgi:hypothetical protein
VPDLGQVAEHDAGVVALGLMPVIAAVRGDRPDLQEQAALAGMPVDSRQVP